MFMKAYFHVSSSENEANKQNHKEMNKQIDQTKFFGLVCSFD